VIKDHSKSCFLELENGLHHENIDEINTLLDNIKEENKKIKQFFDFLTLKKKEYLDFNNNIYRSLEIYSILLKKEQQEVLSQSLKKIKISPVGKLEISDIV
jgi:hypothetical protein